MAEKAATLLIVIEHVPTRVTGRKKHHVARIGERDGPANSLREPRDPLHNGAARADSPFDASAVAPIRTTALARRRMASTIGPGSKCLS